MVRRAVHHLRKQHLQWVALSAQALDSQQLPSLEKARLEAQGLQWLQHQALAPLSRQLNLHSTKVAAWLWPRAQP